MQKKDVPNGIYFLNVINRMRKQNKRVFYTILLVFIVSIILLLYSLYVRSYYRYENFEQEPPTYTIYVLWTGTNEMSEDRKNAFENLKEVSECNLILINPSNLSNYIKPEHPSYVRVKAENTSEAPIDLVISSNEESQDEKFVPETVRTETLGWSTTRLDRSAQRQGTTTDGTKLRTPSYTKGKQRRDCTLRNWEHGIKRNAKPKRIAEEIEESTADNLPQILANMRTIGFGIIRNYKKVFFSKNVFHKRIFFIAKNFFFSQFFNSQFIQT